MKYPITLITLLLVAGSAVAQDRLPGATDEGYLLPNGWTITPIGDVVETSDLIANMVTTPDGGYVLASTGGYNAHELILISVETHEAVQRIQLPTLWFGMVFDPSGKTLYVSGGNRHQRLGGQAPVYVFDYAPGKLSDAPVRELKEEESMAPDKIHWSGLAHHASEPLLFVANRTAGYIAVFNTESGEVVQRINTETNPYDLVISKDGGTLYVSNWASDSVQIVDVATMTVTGRVHVGDNPNDLELHPDGRLFVACANDNTVVVIDTEKRRAVETIVTSMYSQAPEGSTPNGLSIDPAGEVLYVVNADNNNVCVVEVEEAGESAVLGFVPAGWYPSAVRVSANGEKLLIGNGKGLASSSNVYGPHSPLGSNPDGVTETTKSTMSGTINTIAIADYRDKLRELTAQAYKNSPYNDELLAAAVKPTQEPSVVPTRVGEGSRIKHVIYIIKENRTYDQVLGDLPQGNGDPQLCLFPREVTPNLHKIAEEFILFDNLYCDAEVSVDGHSWSNAAYATDFNEKTWPASYAGKMSAPHTDANLPASGYLWDQCAESGLTYRSYGEFAGRVSEGEVMEGRVAGLRGHVSPNYLNWGARDTENAAVFIAEFNQYVANYDSDDPARRLPNYIVMGLPEDHTKGTAAGEPTPRAAVASNDYALGMIVDAVSHSPYWPDTAIFVIEDDSQDGSDHVDARRTTGFVISPYSKRAFVDSTFYTTSSMLRTMELLLGLSPMSQFDAAATPMYNALSAEQNLTPYTHVKPQIDINELNVKTAWGAEESDAMDWTEFDRTPMFALNEIIWKSVKGPDSEMPLPVRRFAAASLRGTVNTE